MLFAKWGGGGGGGSILQKSIIFSFIFEHIFEFQMKNEIKNEHKNEWKMATVNDPITEDCIIMIMTIANGANGQHQAGRSYTIARSGK